ncbi:Toll-like receptor 7 [Dissostichus eleginoides]|uniref:Toll-like receptor 7 n=1 Tax=Dissostichus eleginoides TaxID=100907 RepID=A0AAD9CHA3_DISEL|nr:Toll-like receptor 7 [Dissostichus eleginoides]
MRNKYRTPELKIPDNLLEVSKVLPLRWAPKTLPTHLATTLPILLHLHQGDYFPNLHTQHTRLGNTRQDHIRLGHIRQGHTRLGNTRLGNTQLA